MLANAAGDCAYFYSRHLTPSVSSITPASVGNVSAAPNLTLCGSRLGTDAGEHAVTLGGVSCGPLALVNASCISCALPALPAGLAAPVVVSVAGRGNAWLSVASQVSYTMGAAVPVPSTGAFWGGASTASKKGGGAGGWGCLRRRRSSTAPSPTSMPGVALIPQGPPDPRFAPAANRHLDSAHTHFPPIGAASAALPSQPPPDCPGSAEAT